MNLPRGWLLDLYAAKQGGVTFWVIGEDGKRYRFSQSFTLTFYAAGPSHRLRGLWRFLSDQAIPVNLSRVERRDIFQPDPMPVMGINVNKQEELQQVFARARSAFPDLDYYDVDILLSLRYAAGCGVFPLAFCELGMEGDQVRSITPLETPWDLDPAVPRVRYVNPFAENAKIIWPVEFGRPLALPSERVSERAALGKDADFAIDRIQDIDAFIIMSDGRRLGEIVNVRSRVLPARFLKKKKKKTSLGDAEPCLGENADSHQN